MNTRHPSIVVILVLIVSCSIPILQVCAFFCLYLLGGELREAETLRVLGMSLPGTEAPVEP